MASSTAPAVRGSRRRAQSLPTPDGLVATGLLYVFTTPLDFVPTPIVTPTTGAGVVFLATWALALISGRRVSPPTSLMLTLMCLVTLWTGLTLWWSWDTEVTRTQSITAVLLAASAMAVGGTFRGSFAAPAWALALGATVAAVATLISGKQVVYEDGMAVQIDQSTFLGIDQNVLAFHLCLGLAAAVYLLLIDQRLSGKALALGLLAVISVGILAAGSRTGMGSLIMTMGIFALMSVKSLRSAVMWLAALAVAVWGYFRLAETGLLPERIVEWLKSPTINDNRVEIIQQFQFAREEWMVRGVGAGADASYLLQTQGWYKNAHSAFWKIWIETGLVGLTLWGGFLAVALVRAVKSSSRAFFLLMAPTIVAFFYTLGPLNSNMLWVVFGLALGAPVTTSKRKSRGPGNRPGINRSRARPPRVQLRTSARESSGAPN